MKGLTKTFQELKQGVNDQILTVYKSCKELCLLAETQHEEKMLKLKSG